MPIEVECYCKSYFCWIEVNLATVTCWGYYQILDIGVFLSAWCELKCAGLFAGYLCFFFCSVFWILPDLLCWITVWLYCVGFTCYIALGFRFADWPVFSCNVLYYCLLSSDLVISHRARSVFTLGMRPCV